MIQARRALRLRAEVPAEVPKTAMIMAAGLGKRMRPLTATKPKPLIEVAGKPLLDHVLDHLRTAGVRKVVVNVHYLADSVEAHLANVARGLEVVFSDERDQLLETGGGLIKAAPLIDADPFLAVNSDNFWVDGPADTLKLRDVEVTFHKAGSMLPQKDLELMMSLYTDDAVLPVIFPKR